MKQRWKERERSGYSHSHSFPTDLFPARFPVSDEIRNNLKNHYRNYRSWYQ